MPPCSRHAAFHRVGGTAHIGQQKPAPFPGVPTWSVGDSRESVVSCWRMLHGLSPCREVPMILKVSPVVQDDDWSCGEVVFQMVTRYLGASGRKPQSSPIDGTDPRTLETAFRACGLDVVSGNMDITQLQAHTRSGRPVACLVTEGKDLSRVGHWVVCCGVAYRKIHLVCPIHGEVEQPLTQFEERWKDDDRMGVKLVRWGIAVG